jgi:protoporphyrinogen oxidase
MKIGIIGTGISGLSIAQMLRKQHSVVLFEKEKKAGGLIKCERVNDCLFHNVGGHVFNSKNTGVLDWFWSFFNQDTEFVKVKRKAKILINDIIIGYPIENYLYLLPTEITRQIISELLLIDKEQTKKARSYDNFASFLRINFGETLCKLYFEPYNSKIWNTDLNTVSIEWLEGKLPMPKLEEILISNILKEEESTMVHSYFYYPKYNGSQFIVDRLKENLDIKTGSNIKDVDFMEEGFIIGDQYFDKIIYCGDIRQLPPQIKALLSENNIDMEYIENLRSNGTSNLFCETDDKDISWLYIPEKFTKAHRIIYTGNFSSTNNKGSKRNTCVVEFSGKVSYEQMLKEISLLPGNLKPISSNYEANSYVIQDNRTRIEISKAKTVLKEHNIYLLGRFAEWEYYNMDKAIESAFELSRSLNSLV